MNEDQVEYEMKQEARFKELERKVDQILEMLADKAIQSVQGQHQTSQIAGTLDAPPPVGSGSKAWVQFEVRREPKPWKNGKDGESCLIAYGSQGKLATLNIGANKKTVSIVEGEQYRAYCRIQEQEGNDGKMYTTFWVEKFDPAYGDHDEPAPAEENVDLFGEADEPKSEPKPNPDPDGDVPF